MNFLARARVFAHHHKCTLLKTSKEFWSLSQMNIAYRRKWFLDKREKTQEESLLLFLSLFVLFIWGCRIGYTEDALIVVGYIVGDNALHDKLYVFQADTVNFDLVGSCNFSCACISQNLICTAINKIVCPRRR